MVEVMVWTYVTATGPGHLVVQRELLFKYSRVKSEATCLRANSWSTLDHTGLPVNLNVLKQNYKKLKNSSTPM